MTREQERYLAIDMGGTFIKYAIVTAEGRLSGQGKVPADTSGPETLAAAFQAIKEAVAGEDYAGVAMSMPGRIDTAHGIAHTGGAFAWMKDEPIASQLEDTFGKPATIANDGKCAAFAEVRNGALSDVGSGVVLILGTGIGGGVVLGRQVLMGSTGAAGELTFVPANLTGVAAAGDDYDALMGSLWWDRVSTTRLTERYAEAKGIEKADGVMLLDAYEAGEREAVDTMLQFGRDMAAGIFGIQSVVDVERYAIGGGISARPEVTTVVREAVDELWQGKDWMPLAKPEVVTCRFGNEANLLGALAFHLQRVGVA